jgi:hypothetical protein
MMGASSETAISLLAFATSRLTLTVAGVPTWTVTDFRSSWDPGCVTLNLYLPGGTKENWHTPLPSVFVDWVVPLAMSLISTAASGTTAFVWSMTTPDKAPNVVVWLCP